MQILQHRKCKIYNIEKSKSTTYKIHQNSKSTTYKIQNLQYGNFKIYSNTYKFKIYNIETGDGDWWRRNKWRHRTESSNERDQSYPSIRTYPLYNWNQSWYLELPLLASTCFKIEQWTTQTNNTQNMYQHVHYRMQSIAIYCLEIFSL